MTARSKALSLDAWAHAAVKEIQLASGAGTVRFRPASLPRLVLGGRIPNPLLSIAERVEYEGVEPAKLDAEERQALEDFKDWLVADCLVEPKVDAAYVRDRMPREDREQLWLVAIHVLPAGILEAVGSLMQLAPFRGGLGRAEAPANGAGEGNSAE